MRYVIQPGDTLWDLARRHNTTVDELLRLNPHIKNRHKIYAGREIELPDVKPSPAKPPAQSEPAPATGIPQPEPLNVRPAMFPQAAPSVVPSLNPPPNLVQQDEAMAARGMDPGLMDPLNLLLLGGPAALRAAPRIRAALNQPWLTKQQRAQQELAALRERVLFGDGPTYSYIVGGVR